MGTGEKSLGVLVVDDDATSRHRLAEQFERAGYRAVAAGDCHTAIREATRFDPDAVVTDLRVPGMGGVELIEELRARKPNLPVVVATCAGTIADAVAAMNAGAHDFVRKPVEFDQLRATLERAIGPSTRRNAALHAGASHGLIADSPVMRKLLENARAAARSHANVLLTGESGTGKSRLARYIHDVSPRAAGPFVELHCASVPESLIESELFGHEQGAFTGAQQRRIGKFEHADTGTLFLDEVSEISSSTQVKLLRVVQERQFERVGGEQAIGTDARIITATNRDLAAEVHLRRFREDLYYRLNVVHIELPPLCQRGADVVQLAEHFVAKHVSDNGGRRIVLSADAKAAIASYPWPGNVRELSNAIERAVVMCTTGTITANALVRLGELSRQTPIRIPGSKWSDIERHAIISSLDACDGSTTAAAAMLKIGARTVQYRLRDYGMSRPRGGRRRTPASAASVSGSRNSAK